MASLVSVGAAEEANTMFATVAANRVSLKTNGCFLSNRFFILNTIISIKIVVENIGNINNIMTIKLTAIILTILL